MRRVDWARAHMPLLREVESELERTKPFAGMTVAMCLHVEPKTAVLSAALRAGGARVAVTGSPGTTQDDVAEELRREGFTIYGRRADGAAEHRDNVARLLGEKPRIVVDNGADLVARVLERGERLLGATEETTTGANRLREELSGRVPFPVIVINDSPLKAIVENQHGVGQSVIAAFLRATNLRLPGRRFVVLGYGWCGRGIARYAKSFGARVAVVEPDAIRALEAALDGIEVLELEESLGLGEVFVTATGRPGILRREHFDRMRDGAILANAGHFSSEINIDGLRDLAMDRTAVDDAIEELELPGGRRVYLLARGEMLNLAAGGGNPIEVMDLGLSLQALSLVRIAREAPALREGPQPVPADINDEVARRMLAAMKTTTE